jgi:hypothetical protein
MVDNRTKIPTHALLARALIANQNVTFKMYSNTEHERHVRFCRSGDIIEEGNQHFKTTQDGVFFRARMTFTDCPNQFTWLRWGNTDALKDMIKSDAAHLPAQEIKELRIAIAVWETKLG